ncbi:MAG: hypothetical protein K2N89_11075 [Lachnospiraceae bacterium]|nr:hypothetical protein [Lachnospiraceae bacterium]
MIIDRKKAVIEYHATLGERLEDQLKAVEWARAEQKRILKEKGECLSKELREDDTIHLCIFCSTLFLKLLAML